jgi:hypothetical protein
MDKSWWSDLVEWTKSNVWPEQLSHCDIIPVFNQSYNKNYRGHSLVLPIWPQQTRPDTNTESHAEIPSHQSETIMFSVLPRNQGEATAKFLKQASRMGMIMTVLLSSRKSNWGYPKLTSQLFLCSSTSLSHLTQKATCSSFLLSSALLCLQSQPLLPIPWEPLFY